MHTELTLFCERCGLRLPARLERCPRCSGALLQRADYKKAPATPWLSPIHATRALLVDGAALLVYLLSVAGAVHLAFFQTGASGALVAVPWIVLPALLGGFLGVGIILGIFWLAWAALVYLVFLFLPRKPAPPSWLAVPCPSAARTRFSTALLWLGDWMDERDWRAWALPPLAWLLLLLAFQVVTDGAWFVTQPTDHVLKVVVAVALGTVVIWLLLSPALVIAVGLFSKLTIDLDRALLSLLLQRPVSLSALLKARTAAPPHIGRALPTAPLVAPLSGKPCIGFRLVGVVDGLELNDAWLGDFELEHASQAAARVAATGALLVLSIGTPDDLSLSAEQSERLSAYLDARGIPSPLESVRLAEALLESGAEIRVWAAQSEERADAAADYRQRAVRVVLSGTDAEPMLIAPA